MKSIIRITLLFAFAYFTGSSAMAAGCTTGSSNSTLVTPTTTGAVQRVDCTVGASIFNVTLYEMGICQTTPTAPTSSTSYSTSACQVIYSNPNGASVSLNNIATAATGGTLTPPAAGTYNTGYIVYGKQIQYQATISLDQQVNTFGAVTPGTANTCFTTANSIATSAIDTTNPTNMPFACGNVSNVGLATLVFDNLQQGTTLLAHSQIDSTVIPSLGNNTFDTFLLDSNGKLATTTSGVMKVMGVGNFSSPVVITAQSTGMNVGFTKSSAIGVTLITVPQPSVASPTRRIVMYPSIPRMVMSFQ